MADKPKIWTGSQWVDLVGPEGPAGSPGPTVVSADAGNASRLGTDGRLYTPTVTPPAKLDDLTDCLVGNPSNGQTLRFTGTQFVNAALNYGDLINPPAIPAASTVAGAADSAAGAVGTAATYARADHSHPFPTAAQVGAISQAAADARYVEVAGDTMTGTLYANGGVIAGPNRSIFAANNEAYAVGLKYSNAIGPVYVGCTATGDFQLSNAGGSALLTVEDQTGNINSIGTSHSFVANSIPRSAVAGVDQASLDARYVNLTGDTMSGQLTINSTSGLTVNGGRSLFAANDEQFSLGVRYSATGGAIYFGAASASATPDFVMRGSDGNPLLYVDSSGSVGLGTTQPSTEAAKARLVVVGENQGSSAASMALNLAESNTKATVSVRGNPFSAYSLAIGQEGAANSQYLQGVNYAGGSVSAPVSINPYGGQIGIGCVATAAPVTIGAATTITGNLTCQGPTNLFAASSINSNAIGPLAISVESTSTVIDAADSWRVLIAQPPAGQDLTLTLPSPGAAGVTPGFVVEVVHNIPSLGRTLYIQAPAGVAVYFNSPVGNNGDGTVGGGVGARVRLRGPLTSARILCVSSTVWYVFGDLVAA